MVGRIMWPGAALEAVGTFPAQPGLADRGAADGVSDRYEQMHERGELITMGTNTVPPGPWLAEVVVRLDGQAPACIVGDRFRHAEFVEAMQGAGLSRVPFIWRGFGWKDGSEDIERFRRALFDGQVKAVPSMLLRAAFSDAITLVDPAGNHKLAKARSLGRIDAAAASVLAVAQGARMIAAPERRADGIFTNVFAHFVFRHGKLLSSRGWRQAFTRALRSCRPKANWARCWKMCSIDSTSWKARRRDEQYECAT